MSLLSKFKPKPQPYELDAYFAPGHYFFCRRLTIPAELAAGEEGDYVLLELETLSPFPLEHLFYGYVLDAERRYAFVYAAYRRRFESAQTNAWRRQDAVLPDFMVALGQQGLGAGASLALASERSFLLFTYDGASTLPAGFYAEERPQEVEGQDSLERQLAAFAKRAPAAMRGATARLWIANPAGRWLGNDAWFGAEGSNGEPAARVAISRDAIWRADLRDPETLAKFRREERQNNFLWQGLIGLVASICLLLMGEALWGATRGYLAWINAGNRERAPLVQNIDSLQSVSTRLRLYQESNVEPFSMIQALLPYQNWPEIVYRRFETNGPEQLVIDARASNQMQVTEFKRRLERFNKVQSVELSNQINNPAGSTFTTTIRFVPYAFAPPEAVATNE